MTNPAPLRCTYCGTTSSWSSELTDSTEVAEVYSCPGCERETAVCDDQASAGLNLGSSWTWNAPEPLS
jgi:hypothetical protein